MVNTRHPCLGTTGDERQLSVIFLRETSAQISYLFPNQIGIIEQPLRRKGKRVVHFGRHRETRVCPVQRAIGFPQPAQKGFSARLNLSANPQRAREARGIFRETPARRSLRPERLRR